MRHPSALVCLRDASADGAAVLIANTNEKPRKNANVSVVILTRNSAMTIEKCLASVQMEKPFEIIAVDGHSTDGTLNILNKYQAKVLSEDTNSLGNARQLGVKAARGDYLMFVDSDVELVPGCIDTLKRELEASNWAGIHAKLLSRENLTYWQKMMDEDNPEYYAHPGPTNRIDTIAAMFRREVLMKNQFDITIKEAAEDIDLSRRLVRSGYQLGVSSATAYHLYRRGFLAFLEQNFRNGHGIARLGLKYGEPAFLVSPLVSAGSQVVLSLARGKLRRIPYFVARGVAGQIGVVMGVLRVYSESPSNSKGIFRQLVRRRC